MEKTILKKEDGKVRLVTNLDLKTIKEMPRINCSLCKNGYANKCPKVADIGNKDITKYNFITDGYQINDENGDWEDLIVTECSNYDRDSRTQDPVRREYLCDSLKILVFDGIDVKEATRTQRDLFNRGQLTAYNPRSK